MSSWCTVDRTEGPSSEQKHSSQVHVSAKLLDGTFCSAPPVPAGLKMLLTDLRDRQEELFKQVLDQQQGLQSNMLQMQLAINANTDTQTALKQHQVDVLAEVRYLTHTSQPEQVTQQKLDTLRQVKFSPAENMQFESGELSESTGSDRPATQSLDMSHEIDAGPANSLDSRTTQHGRRTGSGLDLWSRSKETPYTSEYKDLSLRMSKILKRKEFEFMVVFAIISNMFIMCWECQYQGLEVGFILGFPDRSERAHNTWQHADTVFRCFEWFFGCLFLLEFFVKLMCWGSNYFYISQGQLDFDSSDSDPTERKFCSCWCWLNIQVWNLLDFSCVAAFVVDKFMSISATVNPQMIRLLRLFRLFRMVRLLRFLESLDHLYIMTTAISGVKHVLAWAIVLLTIMLLASGLFLVQILHATYFNGVIATDLTEVQLQRHHQMYEYFGTTTRCMLSMFEITLGNWPPVARLLSEEASEWFTLFCLIHKLTIGFAVISVISGVILQETFKVAQTDDLIMFRQKKRASSVLRKKLNALFQELDESGDGKLEMSEVARIREIPEIKIWLGSLGIETDDVQTLFELVDADGDGFITVDEMMAQMPRLQGTARSIDLLSMARRLSSKAQQADLQANPSGPTRNVQSVEISDGCRQPEQA